jgi:ribosome modulation factor
MGQHQTIGAEQVATNKTFAAGYDAYNKGVSLDQNPYRHKTTERGEWARGWWYGSDVKHT